MASKWDSLFDQKPKPIVEHVIDEAATLLASEMKEWPLPIDELDREVGAKYGPIFAPDSRRPDEGVFVEAFLLARWELKREIDAVDDYMRNRRWNEKGLGEADKLSLLFVSRWLVEKMLLLGDMTEGRIGRPLLDACLLRTERIFLRKTANS